MDLVRQVINCVTKCFNCKEDDVHQVKKYKSKRIGDKKQNHFQMLIFFKYAEIVKFKENNWFVTNCVEFTVFHQREWECKYIQRYDIRTHMNCMRASSVVRLCTMTTTMQILLMVCHCFHRSVCNCLFVSNRTRTFPIFFFFFAYNICIRKLRW